MCRLLKFYSVTNTAFPLLNMHSVFAVNCINSTDDLFLLYIQESRRSSWTDISQAGASASQCDSERLAATFPPPVAGSVERVPPSPGHISRFQAADDSPSGKASYTLLTSPSSVHHGHMPPQHPSYLHTYGYGDMLPGMEKGSRSKVLPNEVYFI